MEWLSPRTASVLLAVVLLSGCFVEKEPDDAATADAGDVTADGTGTTGSASKATSSAGGKAGSTATPTDLAPALGNVSVNATGLTVTLTIAAMDAGNATPQWSAAFGDNATESGAMAPATQGNGTWVANVTHTYAAAGAYNITVTVSDGTSAVNQTLAVTVSDATAVVPMDPLRFTGSCTTGVAETVTHTFDVTPGQDFIHGTIGLGGGAVDIDWTLHDPSGGEADAAESFSVRSEGPLDADDPVAGTWSIKVTCYVGVAASYTADLTFH